MSPKDRLVYSTDTKLNQPCPKCKELLSECLCPKAIELKSTRFVAILRIEKQGRGGKTVTIIDGLPKLEPYLKSLTTEMKKSCGSGGTYLMTGKEGIIEIQGDKRDPIRQLLERKGVRSKG